MGEPILLQLAAQARKTRETLRIYDPFYCEGSTLKHLHKLGFSNVFHENRDFYADVESKCVPDYDLLLTNPPYSADNKERILDYCVTSRRPWMLLMPSYIATKKYYTDLMAAHDDEDTFFLLPAERYELAHPQGTGYDLPLFDSLWYINLGPLLSDMVFTWCEANMPKKYCAQLYRGVVALGRNGLLSTRPRLGPRQRAQKRKEAATVGIYTD
eukprot:NODE_2769_length_743_cov_221.835735_g1946_i0.p1 GENE.NODE_2769_length_743_cov_221.835735_g1946_i0~~NODE_2769_length_743_cov_221.835735_g1946_i0.p1  ORF type:complete len:220 (+),score=96.18 NODE_2769_length_743_cov_221.835735_g1946_i0:22-660(+)